jgi:hypothetical protein
VWYRFTPAADMRVHAVAQSEFQFHGQLAIFEGSTLDGLDFRVCDSSGQPSIATLDVVAGTTYYVRISLDQVFGAMEFKLRRVLPPTNDGVATPREITTLPFAESVDTRMATVAPEDPVRSCRLSSPAASVWYGYTTPSQRRLLTLGTDETEENVDIAVFEQSGSQLTEVACERIDELSFVAEAGRRYLFLLTSSSKGDWALTVEQGKIKPHLVVTRNVKSIPYKGRVRVTAHLTEHADVANRSVSIYASTSAGAPSLVASGSLDANGNFSLWLRPGQKTFYTARWTGETRYEAVESRPTTVFVGSKTTLAFVRTRGRYRGDAVFRAGDDPVVVGRVVPKHVGSHLVFKLEVWTGRYWLYLAGPRYKIGRSGAVAVRILNPTRGYRYRIRANFAGSATHGSSTSGWKYFRIKA